MTLLDALQQSFEFAQASFSGETYQRDEKDTESMLGVRDLPVVHLDTCPLCIPFCSIKADHECIYIYDRIK